MTGTPPPLHHPVAPFAGAPLLEVLTRHLPSPRRAPLLRRQQASLAALRGSQWVQTLLLDHAGAGVPASHVRLRTVEPFGRFVWVLDDDDVCLLPELPELLDPEADLHVFRMDHDDFGEPVPLDAQWRARELERGFVGAANLVVRRDLWMATRHTWGERYEGDFDFVVSAVAHARRAVWVDRVVSAIVEKSSGRP